MNPTSIRERKIKRIARVKISVRSIFSFILYT